MPEEIVTEGQDFIVSELLSELKEENERKAKQLVQKEKTLRLCIFLFLVVILFIIGVFVWYLNQYDFTSEQTVSGVYTLVDSDGNVVAQDISPEEYKQFMEAIN